MPTNIMFGCECNILIIDCTKGNAEQLNYNRYYSALPN